MTSEQMRGPRDSYCHRLARISRSLGLLSPLSLHPASVRLSCPSGLFRLLRILANASRSVRLASTFMTLHNSNSVVVKVRQKGTEAMDGNAGGQRVALVSPTTEVRAVIEKPLFIAALKSGTTTRCESAPFTATCARAFTLRFLIQPRLKIANSRIRAKRIAPP